jgi:hypothetical protein
MSNGLQVLNYFLVASAIMATAYVSALNGKRYAVAGAIAAIGLVISCAAYVAGRQQRDMAFLAIEPYREIQARLALSLGIESLRMVERGSERLAITKERQRIAASIVFILAACVSVVAAVYPWIAR